MSVSVECETSTGRYLFGALLGLWGQVVEGVVGLGDPTEQHSHHPCTETG